MGYDVGNALGRGLGALNTIFALRSGQLGNLAAAQAAARNNPQVRAGLINNPYQAGLLGLSGQLRALPTAQPIDQYTDLNAPAQPSQVNVPQQFAWQPNLPPLDPQTALQAANAQGALDLAQRNPDVAAALGGYADPAAFARVIAQSPKDPETGLPVIQNMVANRGGLTMGQQGLPFNIQARMWDQGIPFGTFGTGVSGPGPQSLSATGGIVPPGRRLAPVPPTTAASMAAEVTAGNALGGNNGYAPGVRPLTPPPIPPVAAAPGTPAQAPQLPPGFIPLDQLDTYEQQQLPQAQPQVAPTQPEIGYPPTLGGALQTPTAPPQRITPQEFFGPPLPIRPGGAKVATSLTQPYGAAGSITTSTTSKEPDDPNAYRQKLLDQALAKGMSPTIAQGIAGGLVAADALQTLLDTYAPTDPTTGKRDFARMAQFLGRYHAISQAAKAYIPYTGQFPDALGFLNADPDYANFRNLAGAINLQTVQFAGKVIPPHEIAFFAPALILDPNVSAPEFWARLRQVGTTMAGLAHTYEQTYGHQMPPALREEIRRMVRTFNPELQ